MTGESAIAEPWRAARQLQESRGGGGRRHRLKPTIMSPQTDGGTQARSCSRSRPGKSTEGWQPSSGRRLLEAQEAGSLFDTHVGKTWEGPSISGPFRLLLGSTSCRNRRVRRASFARDTDVFARQRVTGTDLAALNHSAPRVGDPGCRLRRTWSKRFPGTFSKRGLPVSGKRMPPSSQVSSRTMRSSVTLVIL